MKGKCHNFVFIEGIKIFSKGSGITTSSCSKRTYSIHSGTNYVNTVRNTREIKIFYIIRKNP